MSCLFQRVNSISLMGLRERTDLEEGTGEGRKTKVEETELHTTLRVIFM